MKKISILLCACLLTLSLFACDQSPNVERTIHHKEGGGIPMMGIDLTSIEKIGEAVDAIVHCKITAISEATFDKERLTYPSKSTATVLETFKGAVPKNISIRTAWANYVLVDEYLKYYTQEDIDTWIKWAQNLTNDERYHSYVEYRTENANILEEEKEYILFLNYSEELQTYYPIGTYHGIMEIDGDIVNHTYQGGEYFLADVIDQVKNNTNTADLNKQINLEKKDVFAPNHNVAPAPPPETLSDKIADQQMRVDKVESVLATLEEQPNQEDFAVDRQNCKNELVDVQATIGELSAELENAADLSEKEKQALSQALSDTLQNCDTVLSQFE